MAKLLVAATVLLALVLAGCGGESPGYGQFRSAVDELAAAADKFVAAAQSASTGKEANAAVKAYLDAADACNDKVNKASSESPLQKDKLKDSTAKMQAAMSKGTAAMSQLMKKFQSDPDFKEQLDRIMKMMQ